ncbi:MAG: chromosome segregation protein SMC [Pseudonocardiales bacterium]|nr:MAG: chromosome segregation protein SMC [Pseudonocardiales bacterium]
MHLKTLTLKGFKSFASTTTLRFEPGITTVVGPNGSGKSNVVDAIAWVLGEQGAKVLRGSKMEDVIFAGTSARAPLGRAEVTLTVDNTDGSLPIDYTEVSITRRMFRSGESEYEINGDATRLLDIQELLSDSGIGREMHVIVGQGQLETVLAARPEDRRGFIEEAAGVLKHRKRKEKALRKLDAMSANLTRITDLCTELRRQLGPLGRQAEVARRAAAIQAELRDSRLRLLAEDLLALREALERDVADETAVRERRAAVESRLAAAQRSESDLQAALTADAPALAEAQDRCYQLAALAERFRGTAALAAERARHLCAPPDDAAGSDPEDLERAAADLGERREQVACALTADRDRLAAVEADRIGQDQRLAEAERAVVAAASAAADRREGRATLAGQVDALRARITAGHEEIARLAAAAADSRERAETAGVAFAGLQDQVGALDEGEVGLDELHQGAVLAHQRAASRLRELTETEHRIERDRATLEARCEALALSLTRRDGAGALLSAGDRLDGVLGSVASVLSVEPGHEAALAASLAGLADAVAVESPDAAVAALRLLKADDGGRAVFLIGGAPRETNRSNWPALPAGARWALDLVRAPDRFRPALARALDRVAVVDDLDAAARLVADEPAVCAVTAAGDLLGADHAAGGSASVPSVIELQAATADAARRLDELATRAAGTAAEIAAARAEVEHTAGAVEAALARLHESDAKMSAVAEQLAHLGSAARSAAAEAERFEHARDDAMAAAEQDRSRLTDLAARLDAASTEPTRDQPPTGCRDELVTRLADARQVEVEARLAVRTGEERIRALAERYDALRRQAAVERDRRVRAEAARVARARGATIARAVHAAADDALRRLAGSLGAAEAARDAAAATRAARESALATARASARELATEIETLTDAVHRDEVARTEQRLRIETLETRSLEEHGVDVEVLLADYRPAMPMPPSSAELAEYETVVARGEAATAPASGAYHRATCEKRAARAERDLAMLGRVNPLALEEFAALQERSRFLAEQLEDLKATRRDLLSVVHEVDVRIRDVFESAFADTAREFEIVFAALFPGGEGRLVLTDPDEMLTTGIEVEARPPGKKVKRLSLLSGGERSLVAVALLVAIFRARPSPFYVLDEIEAALDDTNLGRLIGLLTELREASQLIVITHQKRTMEIADALYGVSMQGDGISKVISQRMRELAPVSS